MWLFAIVYMCQSQRTNCRSQVSSPRGFRDQTKVPAFNSARRLKSKSIFVNSKRTVKQAHRDSEQFQGENHLTIMQNAHISISHALASLDLHQNPTRIRNQAQKSIPRKLCNEGRILNSAIAQFKSHGFQCSVCLS